MRALKRESLMTVDAPLEANTSEGESPGSINFSVAMNEIVQAVIGREAYRTGLARELLSQVALLAQHWLKFFLEDYRTSPATTVRLHCCTIAEHAIHAGISDHCIAVLWGNTAKMLALADGWMNAERYLRAELAYLDTAERSQPLLQMQTITALAQALVSGAECLRDVTDEVVRLLERFLCLFHVSREEDENITGNCVHVARSVAQQLRRNALGGENIVAISSALDDYEAMFPMDEVTEISKQVTLVDELVSVQPRKALELACQLKANPALPSTYENRVTRLIAEASAYLHDWPTVRDVSRQFMNAATHNTLSYLDAIRHSMNIGIACVFATLEDEEQAVGALGEALRVIEIYESNGYWLRPDDRDRLLTLRAYHAGLNLQISTCRSLLDIIDVNNLIEVERHVTFGTLHIYHILKQWTRPLSEPNPGAISTVRRRQQGAASPFVIPELSQAEVFTYIRGYPKELVPLYGVIMLQSYHSGGRPARTSLLASHELCRALQAIGFSAQIIMIDVTVSGADEHGKFSSVAEEVGHAVVWSESFRRLIDPTLFHRAEFRTAINHDPSIARPLVIPLQDPQQLDDGLADVIRKPFVATYRSRDLDDADWQMQNDADQWATSECNALLLAIHTIICMHELFDDAQRAEIYTAHPHLEPLLRRYSS